MFDPNLKTKIRQRAYEMWESEGRPAGRGRIHWSRAEAEFRENLRGGTARTSPYHRARRSVSPRVALLTGLICTIQPLSY